MILKSEYVYIQYIRFCVLQWNALSSISVSLNTFTSTNILVDMKWTENYDRIVSKKKNKQKWCCSSQMDIYCLYTQSHDKRKLYSHGNTIECNSLHNLIQTIKFFYSQQMKNSCFSIQLYRWLKYFRKLNWFNFHSIELDSKLDGMWHCWRLTVFWT